MYKIEHQLEYQTKMITEPRDLYTTRDSLIIELNRTKLVEIGNSISNLVVDKDFSTGDVSDIKELIQEYEKAKR